VDLPDLQTAKNRVMKVAMQVKEAREKNEFLCPRGATGCFACRPYEKILKGEAELVYTEASRRTEIYTV
jgi:hypothetical protein